MTWSYVVVLVSLVLLLVWLDGIMKKVRAKKLDEITKKVRAKKLEPKE